MSHAVIGTAGHIDHGKTSLVRALTGRDTDSLRDERERGITIDIGFAFLGDHATIIDVPGHERFIKNMVSGVSTIDYVMLVIAADDGVMPQTREHLDILRLLGLRRGMVVLSKADMVDEEWLELVQDDVSAYLAGSFLEKAPLMVVDSLSGRGIPELRKTLDEELASLPERPGGGVFREVVDRAFNVHGHGTVVTGTVLGGTLEPGDEVEIQPGEHRCKVRGIQVHGETVDKVRLGDRAAVNLQGLSLGQVSRGCWLATPDVLKCSRLLDVRLQLLEEAAPLKHRDRVRVHVGTAELIARVSLMGSKTLPGGSAGIAQLLLENEAATLQGDRFVIRRYSPQETLGGGEILDPHPRRHRPSASQVVERLDRTGEDTLGRLMTFIEDPGHPVWTLERLQEKTGATKEDLTGRLLEMTEGGELVAQTLGQKQVWLSARVWAQLQQDLLAELGRLHSERPEQAAHPQAPLKQKVFRHPRWSEVAAGLFDRLLVELHQNGKLSFSAGAVALGTHKVVISAELQGQLDRFLDWMGEQRFAAPKLEEMARAQEISVPQMKRILALSLERAELVQVNAEIFLHQEAEKEALRQLTQLDASSGEGFTVSQANSACGATRRFMVPYLEYLDETGKTRRTGNFRRIVPDSAVTG